jgi:hypothetical protein
MHHKPQPPRHHAKHKHHALVFRGLCCGRRLFSTIALQPPASNRPHHWYPVGREISNSLHSSPNFFSPRLTAITKRILCSSTSTLPHAILCPLLQGSVLHFRPRSRVESLKDFLIANL